MSYVNPQAIIAVSTALPLLGILAVTTRFTIRKSQKHGFGIDDWLILPALVFTIGIGVACLIGEQGNAVGYSAVRGDPSADTDQIILLSKVEMSLFIMQAISLGFTKLSIIFFYRRIFVMGCGRAFDIFTKVLVAIIICWSTAFSLCFIFACGSNISMQWGSWTDIEKYCYDSEVADLFYVTADMVVDVVLLITPIPMILHLQVSKIRRFVVMVIFALGTLAVVISIIRVCVLSITEQGVATSLVTEDRNIAVASFLYWTMIEVGLAVIVACLPTFQVLFRATTTETIFKNIRGIVSLRYFRKRFSRERSDSSSDHNSASGSPQSKNFKASAMQVKVERCPMSSLDLEAQKYGL